VSQTRESQCRLLQPLRRCIDCIASATGDHCEITFTLEYAHYVSARERETQTHTHKQHLYFPRDRLLDHLGQHCPQLQELNLCGVKTVSSDVRLSTFQHNMVLDEKKYVSAAPISIESSIRLYFYPHAVCNRPFTHLSKQE
jgi:hypothetical protein